MTRRTIAFVGSCQAEALHSIYRQHIAPLLEEDALVVGLDPWTAEEAVPARLARLGAADVVVEQGFDSPGRIPDEALRSGVRRIRFPYVGGLFLWPYATQDHVRNAPHPLLLPGPYPAELGDAFLNRLIQEGVQAESAVQRYLDLDIVRAASLERVMELHLDRQRARDAACGIGMAGFIERRFRAEPLFLTRGHPAPALMKHLARQVFERLGVPHSFVERALRALQRLPYPPDEMPIHPGVAAHLGLTFAAPERTYRFHDEGRFTFAEFCRRYMEYAWEPDLLEGMAQAQTGDAQRALALLEPALARCPGSAAGWRTASVAYYRLGRFNDAFAAVNRALALDRDDPQAPCNRAAALSALGRHEDAEQTLRRAIERFPLVPVVHHALADLLAARGRREDAARVAVLAAGLVPGEVSGPAMAGRMLLQAGRLEQAERELRIGLERLPGDPHLRALLIDVIARSGRQAEAMAMARQPAADVPQDPHARARLGNLLAQAGDLAEAETHLRAAVSMDPAIPGFRNGLSQVLMRTGRDAEAIDLLRALVAAGSADPHVHNRLGILLGRQGDLAAAEAAVRTAIRLDPAAEGFRRTLAELQARAPRAASAAPDPAT